MKNNYIFISLIAFLLILNKNILGAFFLIILLILRVIFNSHKLSEKIIKLKKVNQIYISKEEKMEIVFGSHQLSFVDYCLFLSTKTRNKIEKKFFIELSNCDNKTQIDHLLDCYLLLLEDDDKQIFYSIFFLNIFNLFLIKFFPYFDKYQIIIQMTINLVILIDIFIQLAKNQIIKGFTTFDKVYLLFYRRLSYMLPMKSLLLTCEEFPKRKIKPFLNLLDDVKNVKEQTYSKNINQEIIFSDIYKICYLNKFNHELFLQNHFLNIINKSKKNKLLIFDFIIFIGIISFTIFGVFL